ncbi:uncharacterized protein LOC135839578 [Planococcus citri]|uniref:uncharacterized protein LOC135839578 n=1 Tax=Planococcus citri TaxID=170843 RepID=UPI0031F87C67
MMISCKLVFFNVMAFVYSKPLVPVALDPSNVLLAEPSVSIAHIPAHIGTAISKTIQYAETPAITGFSSTLYKPDLSPFGGGPVPYHYTYQDTLLRPTKIIVPKIAKMEPDVVHVPVIPSIKDVELAAPIFPKFPAINHDLIQYAPVVPPL